MWALQSMIKHRPQADTRYIGVPRSVFISIYIIRIEQFWLYGQNTRIKDWITEDKINFVQSLGIILHEPFKVNHVVDLTIFLTLQNSKWH